MKKLFKQIAPDWAVRHYHWLWALWGAVRYWFPSHKMTVIGVTGTNGKSTVIRMIHAVLEGNGVKTAARSTIEEVIGTERALNPQKGTMPGHGALQGFMHRARRADCAVVVLEVTSEGVLQERHRFIDWDIAIVTNVTPEHIERHGSFELYRQAKARFFKEGLQGRGTAIINADDPSAPLFAQAAVGAHIVCTSVEPQIEAPCDTTVRALNIQDTDDGQTFFVGGTRVTLALTGRFNISNALAAIAVADTVEVDRNGALTVIQSVTMVPGRMEFIIEQPFRVVVDYAHTPDALRNVYSSLHDPGAHDKSSERLICVLGAAGGGRDRWKRPELGKIAADYCDYIVVTNEDPYDEDPEKIMDEVIEGFAESKLSTPPHERVVDRRTAIRTALEEAEPGDIVAITGKGSEQEMAVAAGGTVPWDDRVVVREELKKLDIEVGE